VPELQGGSARWDGEDVQLLVRVEGEPAAGTVFFANVRVQSSGPEARGRPLFATRRADGMLEFRVPSSMVVAGGLQLQLGLRFERQGFPVRFAREWSKVRVGD
jgi:hypothetical protein